MKLSIQQISAVLNSSKPINIWCGAVRSGKTYSSLIRFLIEITETPEGEFVILARDAFAFRRNILPVLFQLIGNDARYLQGNSLLEIWGRKIHVVGAHDARAEGKLRGATFAGAYVDEASLIPEIAWQILVQRCAMGNAKIFATSNPDSPAHWLKKNVIDNNPDVASFHFTMLDNPKLTQQEREYLERQHKGLWYRRFILGEWCLAEGAVFDFFDEKIHTIKKTPANPKFYLVGVDYGTRNATAFTMVSFNEQASPSLCVEKEFYWDSKTTDRQKTDSEYGEDFLKFIEGYPIKFIYVDPSAASFKQELKRLGVKAPIRDANNDVLSGIRELASLFSNGDLKINSSCRNLIGEMQSYSWDTKASEKGGEDVPIKKFDHAIDSLRYAVFSYFGNKISMSAPTDSQLDGTPLARRTEMSLEQANQKIMMPGGYMPDVNTLSRQSFNQMRQTSNF